MTSSGCARRPRPRAGPVASVCVWPRFVAQSGRAAWRHRCAGLPRWPTSPRAMTTTSGPARDAAEPSWPPVGSEVDVVVPWRRLAANDTDEQTGDEAVRRLVAATRGEIGPDVIVLKAILESGELGDDALSRAAQAGRAALVGGADFLKTSTGKTARVGHPRGRSPGPAVGSGRPDGCRPPVASGAGRAEGVWRRPAPSRTQAASYLDLADAALGVDGRRAERPSGSGPAGCSTPCSRCSRATLGSLEPRNKSRRC